MNLKKMRAERYERVRNQYQRDMYRLIQAGGMTDSRPRDVALCQIKTQADVDTCNAPALWHGDLRVTEITLNSRLFPIRIKEGTIMRLIREV